MTKRLRVLALCGVLFVLLAGAHAQTALCTAIPSPCVTLGGKVAAANGLAAIDYTLTFAPTQMLVVAGAGTIVPTSTTCATTIDGSVVGVLDPLTTTSISPQFSGTLPSGTYYVQYTWVDTAGHETLPSPEQQVQLSATGGLVIANPASTLQNGVTGMKVYISAMTGTETLQGTASGVNSFTQSVPLVVGAAAPSSNATLCQQVASDAAWPSGTGYRVALTDSSGNSAPGYPMQWQLTGAGTTVNLSNGLPYYHGVVYYPAPILATPSNKQSQSITGSLSVMGGITATPSLNISTRFCGSPIAATDLGTQCNTAISIVSGLGGGEVVVQGNGTTNYSTGIVMQSNVRLHGQSNSTTINFTGTGNAISGSSVSNVEVDHLTVSNGSNQTGSYIGGQNVVRFDSVSGFAVHHMRIPATAGQYSIFSYNGSNGRIYDNDIGPTTFCGVCLGVGNNGIRVMENYIHDITTTAAGVGYGIAAATIAETLSQTQNYSNDVIVANNTIKNVPLWEALDIHGGTNITFKDNYVENAFVCVLASLNSVGLHAPAVASIRGIHIEGNTCKQGTAALNGRGIIVGGDNQSFYANDVWVQGNQMTGYGAGSTASATTLGVVDVRSSNNVSIKDNHFWNYSQQAVYLQDVRGSDVSGNYCYDMIDRFPASVIGACIFPNTGNWDITVENNHLTPSTLATSPYYFLRTGSVVNNIKLGRNYIGTAQTGDYFSVGSSLYFASAPTTANSLMLKNGDPIFDQLGRIGWYASSGRGFWGLSTLTITTANIGNGSFTLNGFAGGSGSTTWYHWLPPYANITIAGAGPAGVPLNAMVLSDDGTNVILDTAASTPVTGANVTYQVPTIVSSNQYLNEWETRTAPNPVQGQQWVFDYPNAAYTNGSAFGFEFGTNNGGFYGTYNVRQATRNADAWVAQNASAGSYLLDLTNSGLNLWFAVAGTGQNTKAGFFGATPVVQVTTNSMASGVHLNQTATNTFAGTVAVSASTSGSRSFTYSFNSAPACTITPITDPTAVGVYWVTTSTSAVTANVKTSGTITFNYICVGNPN